MLRLDITTGPVIWTANIIAVVFVVVLLLRGTIPWRSRRVMWTLASMVLGVAVMWFLVAILFLWLDAFDGPLEHKALPWMMMGFAALGLAIRSFWSFRKWWKIIPALATVSFLVSTTLGINAGYGLTPQLGTFLGLPVDDVVKIPPVSGQPVETDEGLMESWHPPADMPQHGLSGLIDGGIPATASNFAARPATIYLPPAALVSNPPKLPFIIFMMGKPGSPDPQFIARELEAHAQKNQGLAPIAVVVDQLGNPAVDPICIDGNRGNVDTYISKDVVNWARSHLNIVSSASQWVISGYSNGAACAEYFGAKYPSIWGNFLAVSGLEYPGYKDGRILSKMFHGDQRAWDAVKPSAFLTNTAYPDSVGIFTEGELDYMYAPGARIIADVADNAGIDVTVITIPGVEHANDALIKGLHLGMNALYPRLGL